MVTSVNPYRIPATGWWGAQLGASAWMLGSALMFFSKAPGVAAALLGCFVAMNLFGWVLWRSRERFSAYAAIQSFCAGAGLFTSIAIAVLDVSGHLGEWEPRFASQPHAVYFVLLLFPLVMLLLHFRFRGEANRPV
jgi:hypothetical protein